MFYFKLFILVYYFVLCFCCVSSRYLDFCWVQRLTGPVILIQPTHTVGFIRRHLYKEFSFAPFYYLSLSTRSRSRSQCCRYLISSCVLMVFKLSHTYAASYHDIWIFVGYIGLTSLEISQTVGFIRRHFTREFSFAPSYCLSTRSQSRFQNVDNTILSPLSHHALFSIFA